MPGATSRPLVLVLLLAACAIPGLAFAQSAGSCQTCIGAAGCDGKRDACVAECRARFFVIDPKRGDCVTACSNAAGQCAQSAESSCRGKTLCR